MHQRYIIPWFQNHYNYSILTQKITSLDFEIRSQISKSFTIFYKVAILYSFGTILSFFISAYLSWKLDKLDVLEYILIIYCQRIYDLSLTKLSARNDWQLYIGHRTVSTNLLSTLQNKHFFGRTSDELIPFKPLQVHLLGVFVALNLFFQFFKIVS